MLDNGMKETFEKWEQAAAKVLAEEMKLAGKKQSEAQKMLSEAADNINSRATERDTEAERSMARTVALFNAYSGRTLTETEGWMFMVCLKMARARAGKFQRDDYVDMASYAALSGECEMKCCD